MTGSPDKVGSFDRVLEPGRLGPIELSNRIVMPAMDMNLCHDGEVTDAEIAHYRRRAAGGTAMLITGSGAIAYPVGATSRHQPGLSDDRFTAGLSRLTDAVHAEGSKLCIQLTHHGKTARVDMADGREMLVPSVPVTPLDLSTLADNTPEELGRLAAASGGAAPLHHAADEDDLAWLIDEFAAAADRVRRVGCDAVEIHAAHGYELSTFLSAADNERTDRWGGSLENRARLTVEVIRAVREAVGADLAVLVRVSGREFGGAGALTTAEAAAAARMFESAGVDAIHVSGWGRNSFSNFTEGPLPDSIGAYRTHARAIKAAVEVPVIAVGRIVPELAEQMLASGDCDFVAMGRQLLTDPDLVDKLRSGRRARIRPCINCYVCVEQNFFDDQPRCAVNPALCAEERDVPPPAEDRRHVAVAGGGPGGMEVARRAAERGHRVTLFEASDRLGGTAWFSQLTTPANGALIDWQAGELERLGVEVRLSTFADPSTLRAVDPDVVVVATGARRGLPAVPGAGLSHVMTGDGLRAMLTGAGGSPAPWWLRAALWVGRRIGVTGDIERLRRWSHRWMPIADDVVVIGGGLVGLELAEFLAERGRRVTLLEQGSALGLPMALPRRWTAVRRARAQGVTLVRNAELAEITPNDVRYLTDGLEHRATAGTVIIASEVQPGAPLADELTAAGFDDVRVVGDAGELGYIEGAIHSAWAVADAL